MELVLIIMAILCAIGGILGSVFPILPGPPLSFFALILFNFSGFATFSFTFLLIAGTIAAILTVLDYILPSWIVNRFGGSKKGVIGSMIGLIVGSILLPFIGIIIGPFIGAFIGELMAQSDAWIALKAACMTFIGFLISTGLKLGYTITIAYYIVRALMGQPATPDYPII
ncbi:MAG TPA: DUF456 domain-containing protein [Spirochaetota bacterium]|nr:DUF456 domain-containing protein [Spirochaetota bacterium]